MLDVGWNGEHFGIPFFKEQRVDKGSIAKINVGKCSSLPIPGGYIVLEPNILVEK